MEIPRVFRPWVGWRLAREWGTKDGHEWECALAFLSTPYVLSSLVLSSLVSLPLPLPPPSLTFLFFFCCAS